MVIMMMMIMMTDHQWQQQMPKDAQSFFFEIYWQQ